MAATDEEGAPLSGAVSRGLAAAVGSIAVLIALSAVALVAGIALESLLPFLEYAVGIALIALEVWVIWGGTGAVHVLLPERRATVTGSAAFGAMYALAAVACVVPLFLSLAFRSITMSVAETAAIMDSHAARFAVLLLSVTGATAVGHDLTAGRFTAYADRFVRLAGVSLVLADIDQLYVA
ncbi:cytochrome C biogenesis protein [Natrinema amylolyticum]|uniref:cytochrome C biogenesis protein n=1 Tax=Natrinema amylolyticum TaxID=2878679 RepID=UPI001CFABB3E|nr:cytochrome C biogenesis protein [Natrinema amylolyticum]